LVAVVGIAFDDQLDVRVAPGLGFDIVAPLPPDATGVTVTGRAWLLTWAIWRQIGAGQTTGWVNSWHLALLGVTNDVTAEVVNAVASIPHVESMLDLGAMVAEFFRGTEGPCTVTVSAEPAGNDIGEVTYDVIGVAADPIKGYRLRVFGQRDTDMGSYSLYAVERTLLCWRGVSGDGLCI